MAKSSSCGCDGPIQAKSASVPPGGGQKPPSPFFSAPRVKLVSPPVGTPPKEIVPKIAVSQAPGSCDLPSSPQAPLGGRAREPFLWELLRKIGCSPVGRLLVTTHDRFLNWFHPPQSGPVQFDVATGETFAGPLAEIAQLSGDAAIIERGYLPLVRAEERIVDGKTVWVLVHGTQILNYAGEGRLALIDVDDQGQVRFDLLAPPDPIAAEDAPAGTYLLGLTVTQGATGCGKSYAWKTIELPATPDGDVTLTEDNASEYKIQVWKNGVPYLATIPSNWFNAEEEE